MAFYKYTGTETSANPITYPTLDVTVYAGRIVDFGNYSPPADGKWTSDPGPANAGIASPVPSPTKYVRASGLAANRPAAAAFGEGTWLSTDTTSFDYSDGINWFSGVGTLGPSNGVDDTSRLNAALASGASVLVGQPGTTYLISAPLVIYGGTTLNMTGCTIRLRDGFSVNMLNNRAVTTGRTVADAVTNSTTTITSATAAFTAGDVGASVLVYCGDAASPRHFTTTIASVTNGTTAVLAASVPVTLAATAVSIGTRDVGITVQGGTWLRGLCGTPPGDNNLHSLRFRRLDGLRVLGVTFGSAPTGGSGKYGLSIADITNFEVSDFTLSNAPSDGVHLGGLCFRGAVRRVKGSVGDDFTAITCNDYTFYNDVIGDCSDLLFEDCVLTGTSNGGAVPNVVALYSDDALAYKIRRVSVVRCRDNAMAAQRCLVVTGNVEQIEADECAGQITFRVGTGSANTMSGLSVTRHRFDYRAGTSAALNAVWLQGCSIDSLTVDGLTFGPIPNGTVVNGVFTQPSTTVGRLSVRAARKTSNVGALAWIQGASTVVDWLVVDDSYVDGVDFSGANLVKCGTSASITSLVLNSVRAKTFGNALAIGQTGTCTLHVTNCIFNASTSISGAAPFVVYGAGNDWGAGAINVAGGSCRSLSQDFLVDISKLSHTTGDVATNTSNANTGTLGVGPAVYNGTAWKSLVSGNTF